MEREKGQGGHMENIKTDWEELGLSNDFLFGKVMGNPEICKETLETVLGFAIGKIEYPERQKTVDEDRDARSVRLDIYVKDNEKTVYNVEMQATDTRELPKRSRYYSYPNLYKIQTFFLNAVLGTFSKKKVWILFLFLQG